VTQPTTPRAVDYRRLMKQVEQVVETIVRSPGESAAAIPALLDAIVARLKDELGIYGGRLYRRRGDAYELRATFAEAKAVPLGQRVPLAYPPIEILLSEGTVYMDESDPRIDPELERRLGVSRFAAIEVGEEEYVLAFDIAPGHHREDVLVSLGVLRHVINQELRRERLEEVFREARKIQASILPRRVPAFAGFDLWGQSVSAESVGGDFYDFIPITDKMLGLAIADVSGHGLPAALQVRDVYMGLRMGLARDFKIVRTVERLNQIIHQSALTSRFVSMFYGELEPSGIFIYVNAGHPPPFLLTPDGRVRFLEEGGAVLGPVSDATYERGFLRLEPGGLVVLYTDGMTEAHRRGADGQVEEFGVDRLIATAQRRRGAPAREIAETLLAEAAAFADPALSQDDRTLVVLACPERSRAPAGA